MQVEHVSLLATQRSLHDLPRGMERFREYLRLLVGDGNDVDLLPLVAMNPMGREHVMTRLDELIELGADAIAARAVTEAGALVDGPKGAFRHGLVVVDDVAGGWTSRYASEAAGVFYASKVLRRRWLTTPLWVSEASPDERIREAVLATIARAVYIAAHGQAVSLREMLTQEHDVARFAGTKASLPSKDLARVHYIVDPLIETCDWPICFAVMFGDAAARELGYRPLGLPARAGFELAAGPKGGPRASGGV